MLEDDFPPEIRNELELPDDIVKRIREELERFGGDCHYDSDERKIVYHNLTVAEKAYDAMQLSEMEEHVRRTVGRDPTRDEENSAGFEWIKIHRQGFRELWEKIHKYICPVSDVGRVA